MKVPFICPSCRQKTSGFSELTLSGKTLCCSANHCFDIATEGYVNLAVGKLQGGDSKEMCRARHDFLANSYYKPLAEKIAYMTRNAEKIVDMGCGEGYYDREICQRHSAFVVGIDLAKEAVRLAAKASLREKLSAEYAVAGIFDMPFADGSFDIALSIFAPVPDSEAARVLCNDGLMLVVTPGENHLDGLKSAVYERPYTNILKQKDYPDFVREEAVRVSGEITVIGDDITKLFLMTPYYWKTSESDAAKLCGLSSLKTSIDFIITPYRKRNV